MCAPSVGNQRQSASTNAECSTEKMTFLFSSIGNMDSGGKNVTFFWLALCIGAGRLSLLSDAGDAHCCLLFHACTSPQHPSCRARLATRRAHQAKHTLPKILACIDAQPLRARSQPCLTPARAASCIDKSLRQKNVKKMTGHCPNTMRSAIPTHPIHS